MLAFYISCPNCKRNFDIGPMMQDKDENIVINVRCPTEKQYPEDRKGCGYLFQSFCFYKTKGGWTGLFDKQDNPPQQGEENK